jgi:hypothetical protein
VTFRLTKRQKSGLKTERRLEVPQRRPALVEISHFDFGTYTEIAKLFNKVSEPSKGDRAIGMNDT